MGNSNGLRQLDVELPLMNYPIFIGSGLLSDENLLMRYIKGNQVFIITNEIIAPLYLKQVQHALLNYQVDTLILNDGEYYKSKTSLFQIYDALMNAKHHRDTTIIALGGGVIGDLAGFAAATYQRGVKYIQLPTTLLSQVDASIGGKTAINHPMGKNMIGAFYQPHAVLMDVNTLQTLPVREWKASFSEIIKYGLLVGGDFLVFLTKLLQTGIATNNSVDTQTVLMDLIMQCCRIKADFVEADQFETGRRVLLNLGHTVAHALETITHYQTWLHGEAVAIGLYCAALLSHQSGHLSEEELKQVDSLLVCAQLPRRIPHSINLLELMSIIMADKKIKNKQLRFVLMKSFGECYLDSQVTEEGLHQVLLRAVEGEFE